MDALVGPHEAVTAWARRAAGGRVLDGVPGEGPPNSADAVVLLLALHRCPDPRAALADVRRALRPRGTVVVITPSVLWRNPADVRWGRVLRPVRRGPWPHRSALDGAGWLLAAADFVVLADERRPYALPLADAAAARRAVDGLPAAGLWPELAPDVRARTADALARRAGPGCLLPVPLRRLVART